jgi:hypothetical protein
MVVELGWPALFKLPLVNIFRARLGAMQSAGPLHAKTTPWWLTVLYSVVGKLLLKSSWVTLLQLLVKVTRYL